MTIRSLGGFIVPVTAESDPPDRTIRDEQPEVGVRWGNPAAFAFSAAGVTQSGSDQRFGLSAQIQPPDEPLRRRVNASGDAAVSYKIVSITSDD